MPDFIRLSISDNISRRYARSSLAVYTVAAGAIILFLACMAAVDPSFPMLALSVILFGAAVLVCLLRDPLGILTMRVQKKLAASELVFDPDGLTVTRLTGQSTRFERPEAELFYLAGPGGSDYFLQIKAQDGKNGSFYVGNNLVEIEELAEILRKSGALARYVKQPMADPASLKQHTDQFFN